MKLVELKCKNCGAVLKVKPNTNDIHCEHCKANYKLDDEVQHVKFDDMEKAGYDYEKGKQKARQEHEQQKKIEADRQKIEKIRKSQTKTESFIYNRIHSAISKQVMQETIEKDDGVAPVTDHTENKKTDSSNKQNPADFVSQNSKKIIIGALIALFVVAPLILVGSLLFSPLKGNDSDITSVHYTKDSTSHEDTGQSSEPKSENDNNKADEPSKTISSCQKDLQGFTPKEGIYNVNFKIKVTNLTVECDAYPGWNYYTAALEIEGILEKGWSDYYYQYSPSETSLSQYVVEGRLWDTPWYYNPETKERLNSISFPDNLPKKECKGMAKNDGELNLKKGQKATSAICAWIPNDAKNIIYSYYYRTSDDADLLHLTLITKE